MSDIEPGSATWELATARRLWALTIAFLTLEGAIALAWPAPFTDPDEALFVAVTQAMRATGDYVVPRFRGQAFLDRPILPYWLWAGAAEVCGESERAYRLIGLLLGAGIVAATGALASERLGALAGAIAAFAQATMVAQAVLTLGIGHDSALVCFSLLAIAVGRRVWIEVGGRQRAWTLLLAGLIAAAALSKGLLGAALPILAWSAFAIADRNGPTRCTIARAKPLAAAVGAGLALASAWYVAVDAREPGYLRYFFYERHWQGLVSSTQRHGGRSAAIYLPTLLVGGTPWLIALLPPAIAGVRRGQAPTTDVAGILLWLGATVLVFAGAGSRNPTYLLPAFPPVAMLAGAALARAIASPTEHSALTWGLRHLPIATAALAILAPVVALPAMDRPIPPSLVVSALALAFAMIAWQNRRRWVENKFEWPGAVDAWTGQALASLAVIAAVTIWILPAAAWERSALPTTRYLQSLAALPKPVLWFNHVPASAVAYAPEIPIERVYWADLQRPADRPTIFVCRKSRLCETLTTPMLAGARHVDLGGKYHVFFCGDWRSAPTGRAASVGHDSSKSHALDRNQPPVGWVELRGKVRAP